MPALAARPSIAVLTDRFTNQTRCLHRRLNKLAHVDARWDIVPPAIGDQSGARPVIATDMVSPSPRDDHKPQTGGLYGQRCTSYDAGVGDETDRILRYGSQTAH